MAAESELPAAGVAARAHDSVAANRPKGYDSKKAALDLFLTVVLIVPATPLILLAALLIKLTSRGPAFYTQTRVGRDGVLYTIYKLRTMRHNCEKESGVCWS